MKRLQGFTLAELLIALAILGVIATFTIPKVLQSQQDGRYKSIAKEAAGAVSQAYSAYQLNSTVSAGTTLGVLTPYFNYVKVETATLIDHLQTGGSLDCGAAWALCMRMHNGGILYFDKGISFANTASTNAVLFYLDPDGTYSGTTNGAGKSVEFWLYYSGKLSTRGSITPHTFNSMNVDFIPDPNDDPPWFSWN